ncbi:MAG: SUMF1/EgtB/PvdO family nonheme iron enzyme [Hyphomicrobiaceae bacterium]
MAGKIFINYRRVESGKDARLLAKLLDTTALKGAFKGRVFLDVHGLANARDWVFELERQVAASAIVLSVICPGWAEIVDAEGKRRLDNEEDFVRFELAEAFRRDIPVVPVLVDGARMPKAKDLPDRLGLLTRPQAELLRTESFDADVENIAQRVREELAARRQRGVPGWAIGLVAAGALFGGLAVAPMVLPLLGVQIGVNNEKTERRIKAAEAARDEAVAAMAPAKSKLSQVIEARDAARVEASEGRSQYEAVRKELEEVRAARDKARAELDRATAARDTALATQTVETDKRAAAEAKIAELTKLLEAATAKVDELTKAAAVAEAKAKLALATSGTDPTKAPAALPKPGTVFRDEGCPGGCPEMVVLPRGTFTMGSTDVDSERPPHLVTMNYDLAVGKYEVTKAEFSRFVEATRRDKDGGCSTFDILRFNVRDNKSWRDVGYEQTNRDPAACVNWEDAQDFVAWLSKATNASYRLLSEAEWEYAARAGSDKRFHWGDSIGRNRANCNACGSRWDNNQTAPVGLFEPNDFGLFDMHGNVWEWVQDCYIHSYKGAPDDGKARKDQTTSCARVLRGGSWVSPPDYLRASYRRNDSSGARRNDFGFRVAKTLDH